MCVCVQSSKRSHRFFLKFEQISTSPALWCHWTSLFLTATILPCWRLPWAVHALCAGLEAILGTTFEYRITSEGLPIHCFAQHHSYEVYDFIWFQGLGFSHLWFSYGFPDVLPCFLRLLGCFGCSLKQRYGGLPPTCGPPTAEAEPRGDKTVLGWIGWMLPSNKLTYRIWYTIGKP